MVRLIGVGDASHIFSARNNSCDSVAGADVLPIGPLEQRALAGFVLE